MLSPLTKQRGPQASLRPLGSTNRMPRLVSVKKPEDGFLLGVGLDGEGFAAVEEEGLAGEIHCLGGLDRSGEVAEVELLGDRMLAVKLHHFLDVQLLAVVFVAGLGDSHSEDFRVRKSGADGLGGAFDLSGVLGFQILEADRVGGVRRAEEVDSIETLGGDGVEGFAIKGRGVPQEGLQTLKGFVLGLQKNQRVAQDCLAVLSAPYGRRNLRLAGHRSAVDERNGLVPVHRRPVRLAPVLRMSLLHAVR